MTLVVCILYKVSAGREVRKFLFWEKSWERVRDFLRLDFVGKISLLSVKLEY